MNKRKGMTVLLGVMLAAGCAGEVEKPAASGLQVLRQTMNEEGYDAAFAAVICPEDSTDPAASDLAETWPFVTEIPEDRTVQAGGDHAFVIVPGEGSAGVAVLKNGDTYFREEGDEPLLIYIDSFQEDTLIEIAGTDGTYSFTPVYTVNTLYFGTQETRILNFSVYPDDHPDFDDRELAFAQAEEKVINEVPGIYRLMMQSDLVYGAEYTAAPGNLDINRYGCYVFELDEGGTGIVKRRFAVSMDGRDIYEFNNATGKWYRHARPSPVVSLDRLRADLYADDDPAGVAFAGETVPSAETLRMYPWAEDAPVISGGDANLFLIVPRDPDASVTVSRVKDETVTEELYSSESGEPFFIRTVDNTRWSDLEVTVAGGGQVFVFTPFFSRDPYYYDSGHISYALNFGVPEYLWTVMDEDRVLETITEKDPFLKELLNKGLEQDSSYGTVYADYRPCREVYFGTAHDGIFTRERTYAVSDDYEHVYEYDTANDRWLELY